jgi:uncharacterized membrane protein YbaN (DUF454 family)|tara:strand:+ start:2880 stop:3314 length:435 start_codon:yes stop_codon:yes gene_type:complete
MVAAVDDRQPPPRVARGPARWLWFLLGLLSLALGGLGVIVPGLPTTIFLIIAAGCFARSYPRLERWILDLPKVGPTIRDYRAGLGMPRRAKVWAISMIVAACGLSAGLLIEPAGIRMLVAAVGLVGVWFVGWRVPTRERVLGNG